jgi:hypothetical protein
VAASGEAAQEPSLSERGKWTKGSIDNLQAEGG